MGGGFERAPAPGRSSLASETGSHADTRSVPGKRPLTESLAPQQQRGPHPIQWLIDGPNAGAPIQRKAVDAGYGDVVATARGPTEGSAVRRTATSGIADDGGALPQAERIQRLFGCHDVSGIKAHVGGAAETASRAIGAEAYAVGNDVAFAGPPSLHTAAHEAAHVVQQRGGIQRNDALGQAHDAYERHADEVADRVVAGQSAEDLLNSGAASGAFEAAPVVQRKEAKDDAALLEHQARLKNTDVEIPALEGALLTTRKQAVQLGLLSQASFDAGLALSQAMTQLQPAVAAKQPADKNLQDRAAVAAQQLFAALQHDTANEKNFHIVPSAGMDAGGVTSRNPYTAQVRVTTAFLFWAYTTDVGSWLQRLPELIRKGTWDDAFRGYRRMLDGLDLWVADQLRKKGKDTPEESLGNAQQYHAQLRTGLEQIADKHATRLPALFHPDAKLVEKDKAAARPAADTVPMNVYVWKDDKDGKFHLYDLTT